MNFLNLVRYQNLLMLAFMQLVFRYGFLKFQNIPLALLDWQYNLLVLSTVLIAAGGYVINNVFDQETDLINDPQKVIVGNSISENKAYTIYIILTSVGVAIGFYLSNIISKPSFASIFILIAATLYLYATSLKQIILIGNSVIALLLAFSVIIIGIFDLYPVTVGANKQQMAVLFSILLDYAIFTFVINLLREIIKDFEDFDGDYNQGIHTFPIFFGKEKGIKIVFIFSFLPLITLLYYINYYLLNLLFVTLYLLLFVCGPLTFFILKLWNTKSKKDFHFLSLLLKLILFFGIVSVIVLNYNIKYNA
ncbi:4-hydroxybenzoate polyprenyltransferase [Flavobacterium sp. PL11]|uniref:geranylgeranylglycerol-phosphate geranylgeranyltransferase n=1 Tax=Flavobacterium sp. PL11 TaxID=3071717 RepID=UPI002DFF1E60|nr:4-hydroxybenzoate polyprenyltransferase [Flavobacterium sp. PL11]